MRNVIGEKRKLLKCSKETKLGRMLRRSHRIRSVIDGGITRRRRIIIIYNTKGDLKTAVFDQRVLNVFTFVASVSTCRKGIIDNISESTQNNGETSGTYMYHFDVEVV